MWKGREVLDLLKLGVSQLQWTLRNGWPEILIDGNTPHKKHWKAKLRKKITLP